MVAANPKRFPVDPQILGDRAMDLGDLDFEVHLLRGGDLHLVLDRHAFGKRPGREPQRAVDRRGGIDLAGQRNPARQPPCLHPAQVGLSGQDRAQRLQVQRHRDGPFLDSFIVVKHRHRGAPDPLADDIEHVRCEQRHVGDLGSGDEDRGRVVIEVNPPALSQHQVHRGRQGVIERCEGGYLGVRQGMRLCRTGRRRRSGGGCRFGLRAPEICRGRRGDVDHGRRQSRKIRPAIQNEQEARPVRRCSPRVGPSVRVRPCR